MWPPEKCVASWCKYVQAHHGNNGHRAPLDRKMPLDVATQSAIESRIESHRGPTGLGPAGCNLVRIQFLIREIELRKLLRKDAALGSARGQSLIPILISRFKYGVGEKARFSPYMHQAANYVSFGQL